MEAKPRRPDARPESGPALTAREAQELAFELEARHGHDSPQAVIRRAAETFPGGIAAVSSFGADSAVLLHMVAEVDKSLPVVFLDTGKHFGEVLEYRDALLADLGLSDLVVVRPDRAALARIDPGGDLHARDAEACCGARKVEPMARAIKPYAAWFTGRKRFQAATRAALPVFEAVGPRLRVNPLARMDAAGIGDYLARHGLRENPLVAYGYLSIGCFPCTRPAAGDARSGRWAGQAKTECGIHLPGLQGALGG